MAHDKLRLSSTRTDHHYRDYIRDALNDATFVAYAVGESPLTVEELPADLRDSQALQTFIETFGWPDESDALIEPLLASEKDFDSLAVEDFIVRFLSLNSIDPTKNLNNFRMWLTSEPHRQPFTGSRMSEMYGAHPALHRLYVLMPETMHAIKELLTDVEERHNGDRYAIADELLEATNQEVAKAIMLVYETAGRVLKVDDKRRQQNILFPDRPTTMPDVVDAHTELTQ